MLFKILNYKATKTSLKFEDVEHQNNIAFF